MWIDKPIDDAEWLTEDQCPMPPSVPREWLEDAGVDPRRCTRPRCGRPRVRAEQWRLDPADGLMTLPRGSTAGRRRARRHAGRGTAAADRSGDGQTAGVPLLSDSRRSLPVPISDQAGRPTACGRAFRNCGAGAAHDSDVPEGSDEDALRVPGQPAPASRCDCRRKLAGARLPGPALIAGSRLSGLNSAWQVVRMRRRYNAPRTALPPDDVPPPSARPRCHRGSS